MRLMVLAMADGLPGVQARARRRWVRHLVERAEARAATRDPARSRPVGNNGFRPSAASDAALFAMLPNDPGAVLEHARVSARTSASVRISAGRRREATRRCPSASWWGRVKG